MPVSFGSIPPNLRVPLFWAEFDASQAGYLASPSQAALLGHALTSSAAAHETPILVSGVDQAIALFGAGSMLADMVDVYRKNDGAGVLYCVVVPEPSGGATATGSVTFAGTAVSTGTIAVYVAGRRYAIAATPADTPATLATALVAAIAADPTAQVTATAGGSGVVTFNARHPGVSGDGINIALNLRGITGGEWTPTGLTVAVVAMAGGGGVVDCTKALAALADAEYDYVGVGFNDPATLDAIQLAFGEQSGRWAWNIELYGHAFTAKPDTAANLATFGETRNDPHCSVLGYPVASPSPSWEFCAALTAEAAVGLRADPARPLQTLPLVGLMYAPPGSRFTVADSQALLFAGIATTVAGVDGMPRIQRCVTTYQKNQYGQADPSWLDVQTPATLQYIVRTLRNAITTKFPRHKLANDGTRFGAGQAIVTPGVIRDELIAQYRTLEALGLCENMDAFKAALIVERDTVDPNRVNVLLPPDLVNQLRVLAMLVQFRLQFSDQALAA
jgi:phage tail sheath gpL-like